MNKYIFFLIFLLLPCILFAQSYKITGQVVREDNQIALSSASVKLILSSGQKRTINLDAEGGFNFLLSEDIISIQVSHLGYESREITISLPHEKGIMIELKALVSELEEVRVSTGYQTLSAERATGSFEYVSQAQLESRAGSSVIGRLDGNVPGMLFRRMPNGNLTDVENLDSKRFSIRGIASLTSGTLAPLVIVDNFPYEGDIGNINPNDVESVTILKDAAAASIWGAKAGNGVLIITTKKATLNMPFTLKGSLNLSITEKPDLFFHPMMSTSDFIDAEIFLFGKGAYRSRLDNIRTWPVINPVVEILEQERLDEITSEEAKHRIDALRNYDVRNDIDRYINRNTIARQYYFSMAGGGNMLSQQVSIGYDNNRGGTIGNQNDRLTLRSQTKYQPFKKLSVDVGIVVTYRNADKNTPELTMGTGNGDLYPYARLANNDGNPLAIERDYRREYVESAGAGKLLDWQYRPLEEAKHLDNTTETRHLQLGLGTQYQILPMLTAELKYNLEQGNSYDRIYNGLEIYSTRNMINRFTQINGDNVLYPVPKGGILDEGHGDLIGQSFRGQLNFDRKWRNETHRLLALIGSEVRENRRLSNNGLTYGYDDDLLTYQLVDYINRYPIFDKLSSDASIGTRTSFNGYNDRFVSFYGNASYAYKNKYTISGSARKDASNLFGVKTNNKWKPLWSGGVAWNISQESFYNAKWLPFFKVRGTYGYSGNINNSVPAVTTIRYSDYPSTLTRLQYATIENAPNPQLRWEQVATTNLALDFATRGKRISGSVEVYRKVATDLMGYVPLDYTTGFNGMNMNVASLRNEGLDFRLNSINTNGILNWQSSLFLSTNKDKVLEYFYERKFASQYIGNGAVLTAIKGKPAYPVVSYAWAGLEPQTGDPRGYLNGEISTDYQAIFDASVDDLVFHGNALPQYHGAFGNVFNYKGFSLSMNITYRFGYYFRRETSSSVGVYTLPIRVVHGDYYDRWQQPGDEQFTHVPSVKYPVDSRRDQFYLNSAVLVEKGDHIRLQNMNMSYRINKVQWRNLPMKNATFTLYSSNLGLLWRANRKGLDPDFSTYPGRLNLSVGLNLNF